MKRYIVFLSIFILYSISFNLLFAQNFGEKDRSKYYDFGKKFYLEEYSIPIQHDSIRTFILFRIAYDQFVFKKNESLISTKGSFFTEVYLEFEFKNSDGIIKQRKIWKDTIYVDKYDEIKSQDAFLKGVFYVELDNHEYDMIFRMQGSNIQSVVKKNFPKIEPYNSQKPFISKPMFVNYFDYDKTKEFVPFLLSGNIPFRSNGASILQLVSLKSDFDKFDYSIKLSKQKKNDYYWNSQINLSGKLAPFTNSSFNLLYSNQNENSNVDVFKIIPFIYKIDSIKNVRLGILKIDISPNLTAPGNYELIISSDGSKDTVKQQFEVVWQDMPLSLYNPDYSAELMYYILNDDEYDKITSGNSQEKFKNVLSYWQQHDPTPNTPYNEAMAEYFKRCDYAFFNFQTVSQKDGAKTDRGKIYILFGAPDSKESSLGTDKTIETWIYKKNKKSYIFESTSTGVMTLTKVNNQ